MKLKINKKKMKTLRRKEEQKEKKNFIKFVDKKFRTFREHLLIEINNPLCPFIQSLSFVFCYLFTELNRLSAKEAEYAKQTCRTIQRTRFVYLNIVVVRIIRMKEKV